MKQWLNQVGRRGLIVGGVLGFIGFAGTWLLRKALQGMDVETTSSAVAVVFGLALGASGFVLVVIFELIGAGWNWLIGKKPPPPPPDPDEIPAGHCVMVLGRRQRLPVAGLHQ